MADNFLSTQAQHDSAVFNSVKPEMARKQGKESPKYQHAFNECVQST